VLWCEADASRSWARSAPGRPLAPRAPRNRTDCGGAALLPRLPAIADDSRMTNGTASATRSLCRLLAARQQRLVRKVVANDRAAERVGALNQGIDNAGLVLRGLDGLREHGRRREQGGDYDEGFHVPDSLFGLICGRSSRRAVADLLRLVRAWRGDAKAEAAQQFTAETHVAADCGKGGWLARCPPQTTRPPPWEGPESTGQSARDWQTPGSVPPRVAASTRQRRKSS
jgi:hypothetical protein